VLSSNRRQEVYTYVPVGLFILCGLCGLSFLSGEPETIVCHVTHGHTLPSHTWLHTARSYMAAHLSKHNYIYTKCTSIMIMIYKLLINAYLESIHYLYQHTFTENYSAALPELRM